jgi:hypothetical protein
MFMKKIEAVVTKPEGKFVSILTGELDSCYGRDGEHFLIKVENEDLFLVSDGDSWLLFHESRLIGVSEDGTLYGGAKLVGTFSKISDTSLFTCLPVKGKLKYDFEQK